MTLEADVIVRALIPQPRDRVAVVVEHEGNRLDLEVEDVHAALLAGCIGRTVHIVAATADHGPGRVLRVRT